MRDAEQMQNEECRMKKRAGQGRGTWGKSSGGWMIFHVAGHFFTRIHSDLVGDQGNGLVDYWMDGL
jgi:hypothetical protein